MSILLTFKRGREKIKKKVQTLKWFEIATEILDIQICTVKPATFKMIGLFLVSENTQSEGDENSGPTTGQCCLNIQFKSMGVSALTSDQTAHLTVAYV